MDIGSKKGIIFDISRFCLNDGPGIRTTIFLKGCPLKCAWCHNPESQHIYPELLFSPANCIECRACVYVCPAKCHTDISEHIFDRTSCTACGLCTTVCSSGALRLVGKSATAEDVIQEVLKDRPYYEESGGGMTVSGGEPMMQPIFLEHLLRLAKQEGIHTCIETCGYAPENVFKKIAPLVNCFLFDYKQSNPVKHRNFTGVDNQHILKNLAFLNSIKATIILRLPLIPSYNDTDEHLNGIVAIANTYQNIKKIEIMPYHPLGLSKAKELGWEEPYNPPTVPTTELLKKFQSKLSAKVKVEVEVSI